MEQADKIRAIIIDDESYWQIIVKQFASNISELSIKGIFSDIESVSAFLQEEDIDLIFLDVQIQNNNGIEFIKTLSQQYAVIIISSHMNYALEGYDIAALDYLMKPIEFKKFEKAVHKAIQHIRIQEIASSKHKISAFDKDYFLVKGEQALIKLYYSEVIYIAALENYIKIVTPTKTYTVLSTLLQFERSINNHPFLRVHRSYIVNLNYIKFLKRDSLVLTDEQDIPIGDFYRHEVDTVFTKGKIIKR